MKQETIEFQEALEDVQSRFILNLPDAELSSSDRIFFQLEQAFWFYDDFYYSNDQRLPKYKCLYDFAQKMFSFSPILQPLQGDFDRMWTEFSKYKRGISTYGTILLNDTCDKVVLCQDWNGKSYTFPAGKVNQNETGVEAAIRETYEETGFDISCTYGVSKNKHQTWNSIQERHALSYTEESTGKCRTCYVVRGVPESFPFEPVARKEVSQVAWFEFNQLPKKTFAVMPFLHQLRHWIQRNTKLKKVPALEQLLKEKKSNSRANSRNRPHYDDYHRSKSTSPHPKKHSSGKKSSSRNNSRPNSRGKNCIPPSDSGLGDDLGWSEADMFLANEKLLGRKIEYDGNPHSFFSKIDPHRFHIVGGSFMNQGSDTPSKLNDNNNALHSTNENDGLQPFFSDDGRTPWGEVVDVSKKVTPTKDINPTIDYENLTTSTLFDKIHQMEHTIQTISSNQKKNDHWNSLIMWKNSLQKNEKPCKVFGAFRFDVESIVSAMEKAVNTSVKVKS